MMLTQNRRFVLRCSVNLILLKGGKTLLLRRFQTGWMDGMYGFISGHLEEGETIGQAVVREAKEEANITLGEDDLEFVCVIHRKSPDEDNYIDFFFMSKNWSGEPIINEPDKCDDMNWYLLKSLPDKTLAYVRSVIAQLGTDKYYSEYGW